MFSNLNNLKNWCSRFSQNSVLTSMFVEYSIRSNPVMTVGVAHDWQLGFQTPATGIMEGIISFHDDLFVFLGLIVTFVIYMLTICFYQFSIKKTNGISVRLVHD